MLLLAHLDVVEARREDWERDPFTLVEENGYFYGRGTSDDKAMAAVWVDTLIRFRREGFKPRRTIKLALTCGEETTDAFNGVEWLAKNRRDLIDGRFRPERRRRRVAPTARASWSAVDPGRREGGQNFTLETVNPGGHSSHPVRDNAIYELAGAAKVRDYEFPLNSPTRRGAFFAKAGAARDDELGARHAGARRESDDQAAEALVSKDRSFHSMLRTTCVATLLDGGHANNALPQRAGANVNCRIFPGEIVEIRRELARVDRGSGRDRHRAAAGAPVALPPPLDPNVIGPMQKLAARYLPGVPVVPTMSTGATDGIFLEAVGIPTYGVPGMWSIRMATARTA